MTCFVFVYGTLRQGQVNDINLKQPKPSLMGLSFVNGQLYNRGWYPGLSLGGAHQVLGEVYEVSHELLAQLDDLEEITPIPSGEYQRVVTELVCGERRLSCYVYELTPAFAAQSPKIDTFMNDWNGNKYLEWRPRGVADGA
jgi:gamma-glutamylcyclotransferase (GGCT)/AIG2-like uncharacterized protein YtfP